MLKTTAGNAVIPYGPELPPIDVAADGALFFKTGSSSPGFYLLKVAGDLTFGPTTGKLGRYWESVSSNNLGPTATGFTQPVDTNNTTIATTAFVLGQAASILPLMNGVAAVGSSFSYARGDHVHPSDSTKANVNSPTFTGVPAAPTAAPGTNSTQLATTAFVTTSFAPLAGPAFSGTAQVGSTVANRINLTGGATTVAPVIEAVGADTNIDLAINSKGTGFVVVNRLFTRVTQESKTTITANTATTTIDLTQGTLFSVTVAANTSLVFANPPANTNGSSFTLILKNDATAGRAVSWPASVRWPGGVVPPRTTAANGRDIYTFFTEDGGVNWAGSLSIQNY